MAFRVQFGLNDFGVAMRPVSHKGFQYNYLVSDYVFLFEESLHNKLFTTKFTDKTFCPMQHIVRLITQGVICAMCLLKSYTPVNILKLCLENVANKLLSAIK